MYLSLLAMAALLLNGSSYAWEPKHAPARAPRRDAQARTPTRRALLVPIGNYPRPGARAARPPGNGSKIASQKPSSRDSVSDEAIEIFKPLSGPGNDAKALKALLIARYGFKAENVHELPEAEATHDGILRAIQRYLIDEAAPGDECFFYYSGHGSNIRNSLSDQGNGQDETIVPIDFVRPVTRKEDIRDIRDKELARYFNRALDKGVVLTALFDSCHSGSIARGDVTVKAGPSITFDIAEPPVKEPAPMERGALILSAALAGQSALEQNYDRVVHGDFTYALLEVLKRPDAESFTAEQVFQQIAAIMKGKGVQAQPNMDANGARRKRNLFGSLSGAHESQRLFSVVRIEKNGKGIVLDKGEAYGVTEGSELVSKNGSPQIRLRITSVPEMSRSIAEPVRLADLDRIKSGDLFIQDRWAASPKDIQIWMPGSALSRIDVRALAKEAAALRASRAFQVISDPTRDSFTHRLFHDGKIWKMDLPSGATIDIGREASAQTLREKTGVGADARLFISLPLFKALRDTISLGPGTKKDVVKITSDERAAVYKLVGRSVDGEKIEYAWVLNGAIRAETEWERTGAMSSGASASSKPSKPSPLPLITDWVAAGEDADAIRTAANQLEDFALRLNKISGWITLTSPPEAEGVETRFPYKLVVHKDDGTPVGEDGRMVEDGIYRIVLVGDKRELESRTQLIPQFVYVFSIDGKGDSSLLYPSDRGIGNEFPKADRAPSIVLTRFRIRGEQRGGVLGPETYILLTTREPLSDPGALESEGVRTRGESRGERTSPLERLLENIDVQSRSPGKLNTPANWTVQQLFMQSIPKSQSQ